MSPFLKKILRPKILERILRERLSEPLHLNIISLFVLIFGTFNAKVYWDLVLRPHNAFGLLRAAQIAEQLGYKGFTAIEFGVASGAGLLNMASIAQRVTRATGIEVRLIGMDAGSGMPPALDYRDHPDLYGPGDYVMQDFEGLKNHLPASADLVIGPVAENLQSVVAKVSVEYPIGYVVLDVDYYSSAKDCLEIFKGLSELYLPVVLLFLDDVGGWTHNEFQGELLAVKEFNAQDQPRRIAPYNLLRKLRVLKNAAWIDQMFTVHIMDSMFKNLHRSSEKTVLENPYLK